MCEGLFSACCFLPSARCSPLARVWAEDRPRVPVSRSEGTDLSKEPQTYATGLRYAPFGNKERGPQWPKTIPVRYAVEGQRVQRQVIQAIRAATEVLSAQMTVRETLEQAHSSQFRAWPVTDRPSVVGVISLARLERELAEGNAAKRLGELVDASAFPHVHTDQALDLAVECMGTARLELLPVVSRADVHKLEGIVTLRDVLGSYGVGPHGLFSPLIQG